MENKDTRQEVVVTDIGMPFLSMVRFMVKWAIASIPALLILFLLGGGLAALWTGLISSTNRRAGLSQKTILNEAPTASTGSAPVAGPSAEEAVYFGKIIVKNVRVGEGELGRTGVFGEVKNAGDRTLKEVEITIYALGPEGKPVFEKTYTPVLVSELSFGEWDKLPLKPGYSREFGVKMDDAPSEWNKKVEVKVTGVQFQFPVGTQPFPLQSQGRMYGDSKERAH